MAQQAEAPTPTAGWTPWEVAPGSGFHVDDADGTVVLRQTTLTEFRVGTSFEFAGLSALAHVGRELQRQGVTPDEIARRIDDARRFIVSNPAGVSTDLASIPPFMRWFVNTYGRHTLAAIIHDRLISDGGPNTGALGSDTLSDSFFREMMGSAGVPVFKRWIMWAAVAMRTRWAVGGRRRFQLVLWGACAVVGLASAFGAGVALLGGAHLLGLSTGALVAIAGVLPLVSAPLWGRQWGAGIVAAVAGSWIVPPAVLAALGYLVYKVLETLLGGIVDRS